MLELIFGMDYNNQFSNIVSLLSFLTLFPLCFLQVGGRFRSEQELRCK